MVHELGREDGHLTLFGEMLIVRYLEGDCDTIDADAPDMDNLKHALFDARESDERIAVDDTFALDGIIIEV